MALYISSLQLSPCSSFTKGTVIPRKKSLETFQCYASAAPSLSRQSSIYHPHESECNTQVSIYRRKMMMTDARNEVDTQYARARQ